MGIKKILNLKLVVGVLVATISSVCTFSYAENHMTVYRHIDYISGANYVDDKDKLDVFMPSNQKNVPVLIFFHGGALQGGDKSEQGFIATRFVSEGVGVVLANYRLSPMVMHPAHILDAAAVFAWVKRNIEKYGGNSETIYVSGHSAGGYLALLLSLDPSYLHAYGLELSDIQAVLAISPFVFVEEVAKVRPKSVWGEDPNLWMKASITPYIGEDKPPILMIYADGDDDWRKEQNEIFKIRMQESGHQFVETVEVSNRDHLSITRSINDSDDQMGGHVLDFMKKHSKK